MRAKLSGVLWPLCFQWFFGPFRAIILQDPDELPALLGPCSLTQIPFEAACDHVTFLIFRSGWKASRRFRRWKFFRNHTHLCSVQRTAERIQAPVLNRHDVTVDMTYFAREKFTCCQAKTPPVQMGEPNLTFRACFGLSRTSKSPLAADRTMGKELVDN